MPHGTRRTDNIYLKKDTVSFVTFLHLLLPSLSLFLYFLIPSKNENKTAMQVRKMFYQLGKENILL